MRRLVTLVPVVAMASCAPIDPPVAPEPVSVSTAPTVEAATVPVPQPTASSQVTSVEAPEEATPGALRRSCAGTHLDLRWMLDSNACRTSDKKRLDAPAGALTTRIEPAELHLASGDATQAMVVVVNATSKPLEFDLRLSCVVEVMRVTIRDQKGDRADIIQKCGYGSGCGGPAARLTLEPGGDARVAIDVKAVFQVEADGCKLGPEQPMKPGRYSVHVEMPFGPPEATAPLVVSAAGAE